MRESPFISAYLVRVGPVLNDPVELLLPLVDEAAVVGHQPLAAPPRHHRRRDPEHRAPQAHVLQPPKQPEPDFIIIEWSANGRGRDCLVSLLLLIVICTPSCL